MKNLLIRLLVASVFLMGSAFAQTAPTVTLTATPVSGIAPLAVTVTWSSTGAVSCVASGSWSGTKATSGTQSFTGVSSDRSYVLTCSSDGKATATWTPPTQNTDGSTITNLASYELFHATTSAGVATATAVAVPLGTTYVLTGLPAGIRYFGMKAVNSAGVRSDMSVLASKTVVILTASDTANVTITVQPMPPVIVTIAQTAYDIRWSGGQRVLGRSVGNVALNVECGTKTLIEGGYYDFHAVPISKVKLYRQPRSSTVVAKCSNA